MCMVLHKSRTIALYPWHGAPIGITKTICCTLKQEDRCYANLWVALNAVFAGLTPQLCQDKMLSRFQLPKNGTCPQAAVFAVHSTGVCLWDISPIYTAMSASSNKTGFAEAGEFLTRLIASTLRDTTLLRWFLRKCPWRRYSATVSKMKKSIEQMQTSVKGTWIRVPGFHFWTKALYGAWI